MTKSQLVDRFASSVGIPRSLAESLVNSVFAAIMEAMKRGEKIELRGFGSFVIRDYAAYTGRNPKTNETIRVAAKRLPFFRAGRELSTRINGE
jgi:integration host factor subunit beta